MSTSLALFIAAVVAIVFGTGLIKDYLKTRRKQLEQEGGTREYEVRIEALEERVRVLERIVTENNYDLKKEISAL